jgi:sRNA-binding carbon storage regulator CsrA
MLVLTMESKEEIVIETDNGQIIIRKGDKDFRRIAIDAPKDCEIYRRKKTK